MAAAGRACLQTREPLSHAAQPTRAPPWAARTRPRAAAGWRHAGAVSRNCHPRRPDRPRRSCAAARPAPPRAACVRAPSARRAARGQLGWSGAEGWGWGLDTSRRRGATAAARRRCRRTGATHVPAGLRGPAAIGQRQDGLHAPASSGGPAPKCRPRRTTTARPGAAGARAPCRCAPVAAQRALLPPQPASQAADVNRAAGALLRYNPTSTYPAMKLRATREQHRHAACLRGGSDAV